MYDECSKIVHFGILFYIVYFLWRLFYNVCFLYIFILKRKNSGKKEKKKVDRQAKRWYNKDVGMKDPGNQEFKGEEQNDCRLQRIH